MTSHFDIIIIGSGAGGATLAQRLAPSGKSILILERGEHIVREAENWDAKAVFVQHRYRTHEQWLDSRNKPFTPNTHYWVGGNTTFYGAALMRLRASDFQEVKHAGGISPAWPVSLTDMAPYYAEAETLWQVHGARGVDPTEAGDEPPYAYPAINHDPGVAQLRDHWEAQGWKPFHSDGAQNVTHGGVDIGRRIPPLLDERRKIAVEIGICELEPAHRALFSAPAAEAPCRRPYSSWVGVRGVRVDETGGVGLCFGQQRVQRQGLAPVHSTMLVAQ